MATGTGRTLTFLFTDIEDSTRRWQEDRDGMAAALATHDATLVQAIEVNRGRIFKHTAERFRAEFDKTVIGVEHIEAW
ncbi:MAG: class 3 adenylate cyclase [Ilumatobacter sp.]